MKRNQLIVLFNPAAFDNRIASINDCLRQYLLCITKEADALPEGSLSIRYRNNSPNFTNIINRKITGITKNPNLIYRLARRQFLVLQIPLIKQILAEGWTSSTTAAIMGE